MHKQMNQILRKSSYGMQVSQVSCSSKAFSEETFVAKRTCVANSTVLLSIQPKIKTLKLSEIVPSCTNEYVNDKEIKNMTIFMKYHREFRSINYFIIYLHNKSLKAV